MKYALIALVLVCSAVAKSSAPLHDDLLSAKTIYLSGQPSVLDKAAGELQKWGRFTILSAPDNADLIFEFAYGAQPGTDAKEETLVIKSRGTVIYQDYRYYDPGGIMRLVPHSMAVSMVKELRKRIDGK